MQADAGMDRSNRGVSARTPRWGAVLLAVAAFIAAQGTTVDDNADGLSEANLEESGGQG